MHLETAEVRSPVGPWSLVASPGGLCLLHFSADWDEVGKALSRRFGAVSLADARDPCEAVSRLHAYFAGDLRALDTIPVDTGGRRSSRRCGVPCGAFPLAAPPATRTWQRPSAGPPPRVQ